MADYGRLTEVTPDSEATVGSGDGSRRWGTYVHRDGGEKSKT